MVDPDLANQNDSLLGETAETLNRQSGRLRCLFKDRTEPTVHRPYSNACRTVREKQAATAAVADPSI